MTTSPNEAIAVATLIDKELPEGRWQSNRGFARGGGSGSAFRADGDWELDRESEIGRRCFRWCPVARASWNRKSRPRRPWPRRRHGDGRTFRETVPPLWFYFPRMIR